MPTSIALTITPARTLIDRPVAIRLAGLPPAQHVTLESRLDDHWADRWLSSATFVADPAGTVDLARAAPIAGTYAGLDPMGLFWAVRRRDDADPPPPPPPLNAPLTYHLRALVDGRVVAQAEAERQVLADGVVERTLRERWLVGSYFRPPGPGPFPAVVTLAGSSGGLGVAYHQAALLASHGLAALALAYFRVEGLPRDLANVPLEYLEGALDWLAEQPELRAGAIAVLGSSRGAELALLLAATYPERVAAVVAYAPSHVVWLGQLSDSPEQVPAWRLGGLNVRAVPPAARLSRFRPPTDDAPTAYTPWYLDCLDDAEAERAAAIPVERIEGPVMLVSGRDDAVWPSTLMAERVMARLAEHGRPHRRVHLAYDDAGHMIHRPPYWPTTAAPYRHVVSGRSIAVGGTPAGTAHARADSWPRVVAFLRESLDRPPGMA
jgi:dienelactone hydrolase